MIPHKHTHTHPYQIRLLLLVGSPQEPPPRTMTHKGTLSLIVQMQFAVASQPASPQMPLTWPPSRPSTPQHSGRDTNTTPTTSTNIPQPLDAARQTAHTHTHVQYTHAHKHTQCMDTSVQCEHSYTNIVNPGLTKPLACTVFSDCSEKRNWKHEIYSLLKNKKKAGVGM